MDFAFGASASKKKGPTKKWTAKMIKEELAKFIKDWRKFFVNTAEPKHMPAGWSVDSSVTNRGMVDLRGDETAKRKTDDLGRDVTRLRNEKPMISVEM